MAASQNPTLTTCPGCGGQYNPADPGQAKKHAGHSPEIIEQA